MKLILGLLFLFISTFSVAQNTCFTNCMAYQVNNPQAGQICSTTCDGSASSGQGVNVGESFKKGYDAAESVRQTQERREMVSRARRDCSNGNQNACEWMRRNNLY